MTGKFLAVPPDALLGVGVHEPRLGIHELPLMTDRHVPIEIIVASMFVGEDQPLYSYSSPHERAECRFSAVGNHSEETLSGLTGDTAQDPLPTEDGFVPLRHTGNALGHESFHERSQETVRPLPGLTICIQMACEI
jgi:hypothetical protein